MAKEIFKHKPGTKIKITVKRDDKEKVMEVTVGKPGESSRQGQGVVRVPAHRRVAGHGLSRRPDAPRPRPADPPVCRTRPGPSCGPC